MACCNVPFVLEMIRGSCLLKWAQQSDSCIFVQHLWSKCNLLHPRSRAPTYQVTADWCQVSQNSFMLALARPVTREFATTRHWTSHNVTSPGYQRGRASLLPRLSLASKRTSSATHDFANFCRSCFSHPNTNTSCAQPTNLSKCLPPIHKRTGLGKTIRPPWRCETCMAQDWRRASRIC